MKRAIATIPPGDPRLSGAPPVITLPREERYRRRIVWTTDAGDAFLLDLPQATYLPEGIGLALDDGGVVVVRAAPEKLLAITAPCHHALSRIAWHIGNRHTPAEITTDAIYILPDHVLAAMVEGLGGTVETVSRPFEPEGGAYGGHGTLERGHHHHGDTAHSDAHAQSHAHEHSHDHAHAGPHPHAHKHDHA